MSTVAGKLDLLTMQILPSLPGSLLHDIFGLPVTVAGKLDLLTMQILPSLPGSLLHDIFGLPVDDK